VGHDLHEGAGHLLAGGFGFGLGGLQLLGRILPILELGILLGHRPHLRPEHFHLVGKAVDRLGNRLGVVGLLEVRNIGFGGLPELDLQLLHVGILAAASADHHRHQQQPDHGEQNSSHGNSFLPLLAKLTRATDERAGRHTGSDARHAS
jgi:hypothetical protein